MATGYKYEGTPIEDLLENYTSNITTYTTLSSLGYKTTDDRRFILNSDIPSALKVGTTSVWGGNIVDSSGSGLAKNMIDVKLKKDNATLYFSPKGSAPLPYRPSDLPCYNWGNRVIRNRTTDTVQTGYFKFENSNLYYSENGTSWGNSIKTVAGTQCGMIIDIVGGGGGGGTGDYTFSWGGGGHGGGGGGFISMWITLKQNDILKINVGYGGAGGHKGATPTYDGSTGGDSSIVLNNTTLAVAGGGGGGGRGQNNNVGVGGGWSGYSSVGGWVVFAENGKNGGVGGGGTWSAESERTPTIGESYNGFFDGIVIANIAKAGTYRGTGSEVVYSDTYDNRGGGGGASRLGNGNNINQTGTMSTTAYYYGGGGGGGPARGNAGGLQGWRGGGGIAIIHY